MGRTSNADKHLMDAALDLIWEESYGGTSVDDICNRAKVKKGSFYYFFDSKAELAVAALHHAWEEQWKPKMEQKFSASKAPLDRLTSYLESIYEAQLESKREHGKVLGCPVCSIGVGISTREVDVNAEARKIVDLKRQYMEAAIKDAMAEGSIPPGDSRQLSVALGGLIDGITAQARMMNDPKVTRSLPAMGLSLLGANRPAPLAAKA